MRVGGGASIRFQSQNVSFLSSFHTILLSQASRWALRFVTLAPTNNLQWSNSCTSSNRESNACGNTGTKEEEKEEEEGEIRVMEAAGEAAGE